MVLSAGSAPLRFTVPVSLLAVLPPPVPMLPTPAAGDFPGTVPPGCNPVDRPPAGPLERSPFHVLAFSDENVRAEQAFQGTPTRRLTSGVRPAFLGFSGSVMAPFGLDGFGPADCR